MKPILLQINGFAIHSYGLMLAVAFIVGIIGARKTLRDQGGNPDSIVDLGIWILIGAIIGARLAYVVTEYRYFLMNPLEIIKINSGGLAFHGGLIGGFLAGIWYTGSHQLETWKIADIVTPYVALGYAIVRVGCLLNGCCYGLPTSVPWALRCAANDATLRHPTQIYSMLGSLTLFFILRALRQHRQFPGFLFFLYIVLYSVLRFGVEYFREGAKIYSWLSLAQVVCVIMALVGLLVIGWQRRRYRLRRVEADAAAEINR
jgi:phosphatidylglycerol:prolipoprotein diacylglycerol transferase